MAQATYDDQNIFAKILRGEIPSHRVYEDDHVIAFMDVMPQGKGHTLVVPRQPSRNILDADPTTLGDPTLLPFALPLTSKSSIAQTFGPEFVEALDDVAPGRWAGPITSGFGRHIVRVSERKAGRVPALDEVRDAVAREWNNAKRRELEDRRFDELLMRYEVTIESPSGVTP